MLVYSETMLCCMLNLSTCEIEENELFKNYGTKYYPLNKFKTNNRRCAKKLRNYMVNLENPAPKHK
jgi:hypothetical protein